MPDIELTVSQRITSSVPDMTDEQFEQLEKNILADGRVIDPLLYWVKDGKNILIDGNHRWKVIKKHGIVKYRAEEIKFDDWDEAVLWVLEHVDGRRHLTPAAEKKNLGDIYNRRKAMMEAAASNPQNEDQGSKEGLRTSDILAKERGVSHATVERAGAFAENMDKVSAPVRREIIKGELKATEADVAALATADATTQQQIAREVKEGEVSTLREAMAKHGLAKPKAKPSVPPLDLDGIATELHKKLNAMNPRPSKTEISKLRTYEDAEQVNSFALINGGPVSSLDNAIRAYNDQPIRVPKAPAATEAAKWLESMKKQCDNMVVAIDKLLETVKVPAPDYSEIARNGIDEARKALAKWGKVVKPRG